MANSKYTYVRSFEQPDSLLPNTYIVIRLDGRSFHKFSTVYNFTKPNDMRALNLMNAAAEAVMRNLYDIVLAYGDSDEYSFVFPRESKVFERRESKLVSTVVSTFTAFYVHLWSTYFPNSPLEIPNLPSFDARAICYPSVQNLRDYFAWRQVDCHINNLYNTTFWALVLRGGMSGTEAEDFLKGSVSGDKNEILFKRFGVNYNDEPEIYRKGSLLYRDFGEEGPNGLDVGRKPDEREKAEATKPLSKTATERQRKRKQKATIRLEHVDMIKDEFWDKRPWILGER